MPSLLIRRGHTEALKGPISIASLPQAAPPANPPHSYAYFYCSEALLPTKPEKPPPLCGSGQKYTHYTFTVPATPLRKWDSYYTVFCPDYFDDHILSDLTNTIHSSYYGPSQPGKPYYVEPLWTTRAFAMLEASYLWKGVLVPYAEPLTQIIEPYLLVNQARRRNTEFVKRWGKFLVPLCHVPYRNVMRRAMPSCSCSPIIIPPHPPTQKTHQTNTPRPPTHSSKLVPRSRSNLRNATAQPAPSTRHG